jgi:prepilin-type N-terminal cleavage/methylation domain-containing protein
MAHTRLQTGFTIVELLVVIVVIGILAAITVVSYNGITDRANTVSGQTTASNVLKKAELYSIDNTSYPDTPEDLTEAGPGLPYGLAGITFNEAPEPADGEAPTEPSFLSFYSCDGNAGVQISYYDFAADQWIEEQAGDCANPVFVGAL